MTGIGPPVVLQAATTLRWEREARHAIAPGGARLWRDLMTTCSTRTEREAIRRSDAVLVENDEMLAFVRGVGQSNVIKAAPGVDVDRFHPPTSGWNSGGYLLSVCRLDEPRKRLDRLLSAYGALIREDPQTPCLVLAGKGNLPGPIRTAIEGSTMARRIRVLTDVADNELASFTWGLLSMSRLLKRRVSGFPSLRRWQVVYQ